MKREIVPGFLVRAAKLHSFAEWRWIRLLHFVHCVHSVAADFKKLPLRIFQSWLDVA